MRPIVIHEPVWNGGSPYVSIRTDKLQNTHNFIRCDYKDRGDAYKYPYPFYIHADDVKKLQPHKESWGEAYRLYLNDLEKAIYYCTIAWDADEQNEGEITYQRPSYKYMVEAIEEALIKYEERDPYLLCCSMETTKGSSVVDLTDLVRMEWK